MTSRTDDRFATGSILVADDEERILRALDAAGGVKKDAAELMGISQRALSHYLAKYRLAGSSEQSVSEEGRS
jgi:predicted transcriptional regulator